MTKARDLANAADVLDDVSATELSYVNGVTSAIQTQLNNKQAVVANVNDTEIGYLDGVTSAIQTQLDAKVAKSLVDAKGDLLVGSANDTVSRLAVASTAGYLLTVDSAEATGLKWAAPAGGGKVLQVVSTTSTSETYSQSSTFSDVTGSSLSITPSATSSKVLVLLGLPSCEYRNSTQAKLDIELVNGSNTRLALIGYELQKSADAVSFTVGYSYLHSPNTTSAYTYKVRMRSADAINGVYVNRSGQATISVILMEIGA